MQRFYSEHYVDAQPVEIDERTALAAGTYIVEVDQANAPRHLQFIRRGDLIRIEYRDGQLSPEIVAFQHGRYPGVPSRIFTTPTRAGEAMRYTMWELAPDGTTERRTDFVLEPRRATETWFYGNGQPGGVLERIYDEHGEQVEVREHSPDGRVLVHD